MKPIIFKVDKVFKAFKEEGKIATFRKGELPDDQEFWIRRSRTGKKRGEADLVKAEYASQARLEPFEKAHKQFPTGFDLAQTWYNRVIQMYNAGHVPSGWILYLEARWIE